MQKLFIISSEKIYEDNNNFYCDNIDLKSTPEGLNKNFEVNLIARKSNIKRSHRINIKNIKQKEHGPKWPSPATPCRNTP